VHAGGSIRLRSVGWSAGERPPKAPPAQSMTTRFRLKEAMNRGPRTQTTTRKLPRRLRLPPDRERSMRKADLERGRTYINWPDQDGHRASVAVRMRFPRSRREPARGPRCSGRRATAIRVGGDQRGRTTAAGVERARHDGRQANGEHGREADDRRAAYDGCDDAPKEARSGEKKAVRACEWQPGFCGFLLSRSGPRPPPSPDSHSSGNSPECSPATSSSVQA
jgi:hypothetical protein